MTDDRSTEEPVPAEPLPPEPVVVDCEDLGDVYAELEAALIPLRAAQPGITNEEVAPLLPKHLRQQLWERAVDNYLEAELAKPRRPTAVATAATVLDAEDA